MHHKLGLWTERMAAVFKGGELYESVVVDKLFAPILLLYAHKKL